MRKQLGKIQNEAQAKRYRRRLSIRNKVNGTTERPRVCTIRSNKHMVVQVIDDTASKTLFSVQTYGKTAPEGVANTVEGIKPLGVALANKLKENKIDTVVFDRCGFKYTGVLASLADTMRENGIKI